MHGEGVEGREQGRARPRPGTGSRWWRRCFSVIMHLIRLCWEGKDCVGWGAREALATAEDVLACVAKAARRNTCVDAPGNGHRLGGHLAVVTCTEHRREATRRAFLHPAHTATCAPEQRPTGADRASPPQQARRIAPVAPFIPDAMQNFHRVLFRTERIK